MLEPRAVRRSPRPQIQPGLAVELIIDFYGERVSILTDHVALGEQICLCFGGLACAGGLVRATRKASIRVITNDCEEAACDLELAWSRFSTGFAAAVAHRFLLLHGATVVCPQGGGAPSSATAFVGPSRSGKTTLCLAAAALGCQVLGDDIVALEWHSGRVFAVPSPLRPRPDAMLASAVYPYVGSPIPTPPAHAPLLTRVVLLGSLAVTSIVTSSVLQALHAPPGIQPGVLLARFLSGVAQATLVRAPALPPIGPSLAPQMRYVERLLAPETES